MERQLSDLSEKAIYVGLNLYALGAVFSFTIMEVGCGIALFFTILKKIINRDIPVTDIGLNRYILAFLVGISLSFLDIPEITPSGNLEFRRYIEPILLFFVVVEYRPRSSHMRNWIICMLIGMLFSIIFSFYAFHMGHGRAGSMVHIMEYSNLLVFMLLFTITYTIWGGLILWKKISLFLISILGIVSLIITQTRGAWVAFLISLGTISAIKSRKSFAIFLFLFVLFFGTIQIFTQNDYVKRLNSIVTEVKSDVSITDRLDLLEYSLSIYGDHFINGIGFGNFSETVERHAPGRLEFPHHAHNDLMQLATQTGTLGLLTFIILFMSVIKYLFTYYKNSKETDAKLFFLATLGMTISYLSHGLTEYNLEDCHTSRLLWFFLAMTTVMGNRLMVNSDHHKIGK